MNSDDTTRLMGTGWTGGGAEMTWSVSFGEQFSLAASWPICLLVSSLSARAGVAVVDFCSRVAGSTTRFQEDVDSLPFLTGYKRGEY